jgi:hypothetical protein
MPLNVGAGVVHDADELVTHPPPMVRRLEGPVGPQVAAANARTQNADDRVGRLLDRGVGDLLDADITGAIHQRCAHRQPPVRLQE